MLINRSSCFVSIVDPEVVLSRYEFFDRFAADFRRTGNEIIATAPSQAEWRLSYCNFVGASFEVSHDGGANIRHGRLPVGRFQLRIRMPGNSVSCRVDGQDVGPRDVALIPPGQDFIVMTGGPCKWIAVTLSVSVLNEDWLEPIVDFPTSSVIVDAPPRLIEGIVQLSKRVVNYSSGNDVCDADNMYPLVVSMLAGVTASFDPLPNCKRRGHPISQRRLQSALAFLETHQDSHVSVRDVSRAANVCERTLLRLFQQFFGFGPGRFMKLLQLNRVRWMLRNQREPRGTLTSQLTDFNVTEFGRFAVAYKTLFGESPSTTRRKQIAAVKSLAQSANARRSVDIIKSPILVRRHEGTRVRIL